MMNNFISEGGKWRGLNKTNLLQAAMAYAARHWHIFPCNPSNKAPVCAGGCKRATCDRRVLKQWWGKKSNYLIGLATGVVSDIWAIDCDTPEALEYFRGICRDHAFDVDEATLWQQTPRERHYLFHVGCLDIRNSAGKIYKKLDVRGEGGYIIIAPSIRADGDIYQWGNDIEPAATPAWLATLLSEYKKQSTHKPTTTTKNHMLPTGYGNSALKSECEIIRATKTGGRNCQLNISAMKMGQIVAAGMLERGEVEKALQEAALASGLPEGEAIKTIQSGLTKGLNEPRSIAQKTGFKVDKSERCVSDFV